LWQAYEQLEKSKVRGVGAQKLLTNLVSLVRFALGKDALLEPFSATVDRRFDEWLAQQQQGGRAFTPEQCEWLAMIKDHIATSVAVGWDDFDNVPFSDKGGRVKADNLFGQELENVMQELNTVLVG
jgi:type I restriction enzyme, R subunit